MRTKLGLFCDRFIEAGWLAAVITVPLFFNIYSQRVFEPDKISILRSLALAMSAAWIIRALDGWRLRRTAGKGQRDDTPWWRKIVGTPLVLPTLFLIAINLLSTATSVVPRTSLWGSHVRLQGMYSLLSYILIFFLMLDVLRTKKQLNRLITTMILVSFPIALYGLVQHFGLDPLPWGGDVTRRVTSSMGNAVFVSAYLIMVVPLTLTRLLENWKEAVGDVHKTDAVLSLVSFAILVGTLLTAMFLGRRGAPQWLSWGVLLAGVVIASVLVLLRPSDQRPHMLAIFMPLTFAFLVGFVWVLEIPFPPADSKYFGWGILASLVFIVAMIPFALYLYKPVARLVLVAGYFVILIAQLVTIFYSQSRGPFLGLVGGMLLYLVLLGLSKRRLWLSWGSVILAVLVVVGFVAFNTVQSPVVEKLREMPYIGRLGKVFQTESKTGKVRVLIWEGATKMIGWHAPLEFPGPDGGPDKLNVVRPIIGYGPESMYVAYNRFYPPDLAHFEKRNATPDRSHNDTLDSLVFTGVIGFAAYMLMYISIFYYGFKWLGLVRRRWQKYAFVGLLVGGGALGFLGFWLWQGLAFLGVGIPFGGLVGLGVYTLIVMIQASRSPKLRQDLGGRYAIWIVALMAAVIAHFIETQFGFDIAATRTYLWAYTGMMVVIGWRLAVEPSSVSEEVKEEAPRPSRKRRRGSAHPPQVPRVPDSVLDWRSGALTLGVIAIMILVTMLFDYITVQPDDPGVLLTIWHSLTRSRGETSLVILSLLIVTWGMIGLMGLCDLAVRPESQGRTVTDWLAAVGGFILVSLFGAGLFALLHAARVRPLSITSPDAPIPLADTYAFFVAFLLLTMIALAVVLVFLSPARRTAKPWRWANAPGDFVLVASLVVLPIAAVVLMVTTNINGVRADILFKQGQGLESAKQWDAALFFYDKALALAPHEDFYYLFQARSFMDKGTQSKGAERDALFQKSADAMIRAWKEAPLNTDHPRNLAKLYLAWGNLSEGEERTERLNKALEYSEAARKLSPNNAQILNERGQIYSVLGDLEKAEEQFKKSLELDDEYVQTYLLLGENYMLQKKWEEAAQAYEKAIELKAKTQAAYRGLGYVYTQLGDTEAALKIYEKAVELWPKSFEEHKNLAILYQQVGRPEDALEQARIALELAPENQKKAMENFVAQLQGAIPTSPEDAARVQELMTQGQTQVQNKEWDAAQKTFEQVIELDPNNAVAHSMLAYVYARQGRLQDAIAENQATIRLSPNDYNSYKNLAILYQQTGDLAKALEFAEKALALAPESEKTALETYIEQLKQAQGEATPAAPPQKRAGDLPPQERNNMYSNPPEMVIDPAKSYRATIVTEKGNIVVELDAADAPQTVNNFVYLARQGFYDGLTFHRVENQPGFALIQGGDPTGTGRGGPGYTIPAEIGLPHNEGAIAMARLGDQVNPERASSGSQFYICLVPIHQLDGAYTVFGYVVEGLDVAKRIAVGDKILTIVIQEE